MSKPCTGVEDCPCKSDCSRHGKCCECIAHHKEGSSLVACMKRCAAASYQKDPGAFTEMLEKLVVTV